MPETIKPNQHLVLKLTPIALLILVTITGWYFESSLAFRVIVSSMVVAAAFLYFRGRPYFLILLTLLLGASALFNLIFNRIFIEWVTLLATLIFAFLIILTGNLLRRFLDFEWLQSKTSHLLALGLVLTELFWVLSLLASDPLVKGALLVVVFHVLVGISRNQTTPSYPIIGGIFFFLLLRFL